MGCCELNCCFLHNPSVLIVFKVISFAVVFLNTGCVHVLVHKYTYEMYTELQSIDRLTTIQAKK